MLQFRSCVPEIEWPAVPGGLADQLVTLLYQLQQTELWDPERLREHQSQQLTQLLAHALRTVPFYADWFTRHDLDNNAASLVQEWSKLPILDRATLQQAGSRVNSTKVPPDHGAAEAIQTSGSTGQPIKTLTTRLSRFMYAAFTVREHLWHGRDHRLKMAAIRPDRPAPDGDSSDLLNWGPPLEVLYRTGKSALLTSSTDLDTQCAWLSKQQPNYLLTLPSNLAALTDAAAAGLLSLEQLRGLRTYGETVDESLRQRCQEVWGQPVIDMYSAQELGYIALQCPQTGNYHVQSESVLTEILDQEGRECKPGEIGRVVLTPLHNFATPLIRYQINDYAEVGAPCPCGRGLPVLNRILGRRRNMAVSPDGQLYWPSFPSQAWSEPAPIKQLQLVQKAREHIEVNYLMDRDLAVSEQTKVEAGLNDSLGYAYTYSFCRHTQPIRRGANNKYEDFVCELDD